ncbi:hypothetical protein V2J94_17500 [Streptomyces sp. DSM 41524]|uniref:Uncharacterized protein n=1 Tax=Streptomyces asiaticus subsp. ignotus TaxID=3098222 RepID=A0ABU7PX16_9ACTN|nr:hypothetical protein [Streptomyces sp. DSM 41524]
MYDYFAAPLPLLDRHWQQIRTRLSTASSPGAAGPTNDQEAGREFCFLAAAAG